MKPLLNFVSVFVGFRLNNINICHSVSAFWLWHFKKRNFIHSRVSIFWGFFNPTQAFVAPVAKTCLRNLNLKYLFSKRSVHLLNVLCFLQWAYIRNQRKKISPGTWISSRRVRRDSWKLEKYQHWNRNPLSFFLFLSCVCVCNCVWLCHEWWIVLSLKPNDEKACFVLCGPLPIKFFFYQLKNSQHF